MTMRDQLTPEQREFVDSIDDPGDHYEAMLSWQANILAGRPMPEDLDEHEQTMYRNLSRELDAAGRLGYVVAVASDVGGAPEEPAPAPEPRTPVDVYPDTDVMSDFIKRITLGAEKPDGLDELESAAWDRLAADVAESRKKGYIIDIPAD